MSILSFLKSFLFNFYILLMKFNSIRPMMLVIYLLIRATFSQKTHNALNLTTYSCFILLKKKEEEEEERREERRRIIKRIN